MAHITVIRLCEEGDLVKLECSWYFLYNFIRVVVNIRDLVGRVRLYNVTALLYYTGTFTIHFQSLETSSFLNLSSLDYRVDHCHIFKTYFFKYWLHDPNEKNTVVDICALRR